MAVKRVTENKGKNTPGVDGVLWKSSKDKLRAALSLSRKGYVVNKGYYWIANKYFRKVGTRKWTFFGTFDNRTEIYLKYASDTIIKRHVLINGKANPYCARWDRYYRRRYAMSKAA